MSKIAVALSLVLACVSIARADEKDEVGKASKKATEMPSYAFKVALELEGVPWANGPIEFTGAFNRDTATYVKGEVMGQEFEAYRRGEKTVVKRDGEWQLSERGGGRGMGMMSRALKSPHDELKDMEKRFKEVKKGEKKTIDGKECIAYEGDLTAEGLKDLLPMGRGMQNMGDTEMSGKAKVWIDEEGTLRRYEITANVSFSFQGNPVEMKIARAIDLTGIGDTKVEVPKEVADLFEKKEEKKDEEKR